MRVLHDKKEQLSIRKARSRIILPLLLVLFWIVPIHTKGASACTDLPVRISGTNSTCYSGVQAAYNAASDGAVIQSKNVTFLENLNANRNVSITLQGGYNSDYSAIVGLTYLKGMITTSAGTLTAGNFQTTAAPIVIITSPSPGFTNNKTPLLTYTVSDGSVKVYVDNAIVSKISGNNLDSLPDGFHTVRVESVDSGANIGSATITFTVDATGPSGTIVINNGAQYTNSTSVTLFLSATDMSGISQMKFSNDGQNWSNPVGYAQTASWTVTTGNGSKIVYAMFQDNAGNWSAPCSNTIILDPTSSLDPDASNIYCNGTGKYIVGASTFTSGMTVPVAGSNGILIDLPINGSTVAGPEAIVKGAIDTTIPVNKVTVQVSTSPTDTGTSYSAEVNGNYFAAKVSLATAGSQTITAVSYDKNGGQHEASVTVYASAQSNSVDILASPSAGIPTTQQNGQIGLDVSLQAEPALLNAVTIYSWDFNGSGSDQLDCFTHANVTAEYQQPGLYLTSVAVTDNSGNKYTGTTIVNVLYAAQMTSILKAIWTDVKTALANGNIPAALNDISDSSQAMYQANFQLLNNYLYQISQDMGDITLKGMDDNSAEMELLKTENGVQHSYYVEFTRATDGSWRLNFF